MNMDKTFEQLKTQVFDLCSGGSSNNCQIAFCEFRLKYTIFKQPFFASREQCLRDKGKEKTSNITSCERSLEENEKQKENEDDIDVCSIDKFLKEHLIGIKKDESPTS